MKLEELMVGDIIFQHHPKDNTPHIVKVSVDTLDLMDKMKIGLIQEQSPLYRIIEPIPLTPEILEKNGWKSYSRENTLIYGMVQGFEIVLAWMDYYWQLCVDGIIYRKIKIINVHELQHTLKLCGIEKTIEL